MKDDKLGPYGCLCKTLHHKLTGDGCSICNPEYVARESLDLDYYKTVATTQTDPEILLLELIDLIEDVEHDRERIKRKIGELQTYGMAMHKGYAATHKTFHFKTVALDAVLAIVDDNK